MLHELLREARELRRRALETVEQAIRTTEENLPRLERLARAGIGVIPPTIMHQMHEEAKARLERLRQQRTRLLAREAEDCGLMHLGTRSE